MKKTIIGGVVVTSLLGVGAWVGLRGSECREARVICTPASTSPYEEVITLCGSTEPATDPRPDCTVYEASAPYAAPLWKDAVVTYAAATEPKTLDTCACSTGSGCEWSPDDGKTWLPLRRGEAVRAGSWRGAGCVAMPCGIHSSMVSGVGAKQPLDYNLPKDCGGPSKATP